MLFIGVHTQIEKPPFPLIIIPSISLISFIQKISFNYSLFVNHSFLICVQMYLVYICCFLLLFFSPCKSLLFDFCFALTVFFCIYFLNLLIQPSDQQKTYHPWYHLPFTPPSLKALVGCICALCSALFCTLCLIATNKSQQKGDGERRHEAQKTERQGEREQKKDSRRLRG